MTKKIFLYSATLVLIYSCYQPQRDCAKFKKGNFSFTSEIDNKEITTTFMRNDTLEIDFFNGVADTSSVRWINDCEYIVKKLHPKSKSEEQSIHMKILSTTENSYTFEYNIVGKSQTSRGTAIKLE
ncbi:DNA topoisomerase IV [uncultured Kriegella sp.]|uniref:DNA topoisomerase IV n=1 Tax=uncultured Kriegella sp. TaxID=1798910 RepID=UPI0030DDB408|tara:strand:- start:171984 stop:172361 length:378 start_codon:yes stop_codon:yes gene_type:complete